MKDAIVRMSAAELAAAILRGAITSQAAIHACIDRIERLDARLRAFVTVAADDALGAAREADWVRSDGGPLGPLHGVPVAIKDLTATQGIRTTFGCGRFKDYVPVADEACVEKLRQAGAIILGKTNTPEFGFGAVCDNDLCGPTANPWNETLTSGGSSGGAAVAVTAGMAFLAHGTDFGGSVRTPASFCGCVGLRPTPDLTADPARGLAWSTLSTHGVLARSVADAALMLRAMVGAHPADPTSAAARCWQAPELAASGERPETSVRVAASATLGDSFRIDPEVRHCFQEAERVAAACFARFAPASPDCADAARSFKVLRAAQTWHNFRHLLDDGEADLGESLVWNVKEGKHLSAEDYLSAEAARSRLYREFARFFEEFDILMLPAASVLPFPNAQREVWAIDGVACETIIDYLAPTFIISLVGFPAISLPALWTADGRPFGVQLVGRPYEEAMLLKAALRLESQASFRHRWPPLS